MATSTGKKDEKEEKDDKSSAAKTIIVSVISGVVSAIGVIGTAYLSGIFQVQNTAETNRGTQDLAVLTFSNDLIKDALKLENPANGLLFYADIGLLRNINVDKVREYATREQERVKDGGGGQSLLPSFSTARQSKLWLDKGFFEAFAPNARADLVESVTTTGNYILTGFGINENPKRLSAFLANISFTTAGLTKATENANYSKSRLLQVFPGKFDEQTAEQYANHPERILNRVYANRIGNGPEESGDGWKFRGRGFFQISGRANYQRMGEQAGIDLVDNPDMLDNPHVSLLIAAVFWYNSGLNQIADKEDAVGVSRRISGGSTGLADIKKLTEQASGLLGTP